MFVIDSELSKSLATDQRKVRELLEHLENALLVRRIQSYFINILKRLVKSLQGFFKGAGMLHAAAGIETLRNLDGFLYRGGSFKAFVIQQITAVLRSSVSRYF